MHPNQISVGILAGGKSRRMGKNKVMLPFKNQTFLEHIISECSDFEEIILSVASIIEDMKEKQITDEKEDYGPLEGIYQLLKASQKEYLLVLAGDMPRITKEFLYSFAKAYKGEDCYVLRTSEGGLHPLCAIYSKQVLALIEQFRARDEKRPRKLFEQCQTTYMDIEKLGFFDEVVDNINTPEEYERLVNQNEIN